MPYYFIKPEQRKILSQQCIKETFTEEHDEFLKQYEKTLKSGR